MIARRHGVGWDAFITTATILEFHSPTSCDRSWKVGAMVPVPGGKMGKTFKSQTQSGMMSVQPFWQLTIEGSPIAWADLLALKDEAKFSEQKSSCESLGFELLVKRAKIGTSKHVRVRPQFKRGWEARGVLAVWDEQIDLNALKQILEYAGQYKGLCDWRPGGRTPGPYGTFEAKVSILDQ
jgi:hypothetical protein